MALMSLGRAASFLSDPLVAEKADRSLSDSPGRITC